MTAARRSMTALPLAAALALGCSSGPGPAKPEPPPDKTASPQPEAKPVTDAELVDAKVAAIELRGLERVGESRARLAISIQTGEAFDRLKIRESLRQLMTIRGIADARAVAFRAAGGIGLAFVIVESPVITEIKITGNQAVAAGELMTTSGVSAGAPLDPVAAQRGALAIKARYQGIGHFRAEVDWKQTGTVITYTVHEGPRASISKIAFPGARALSPARLGNIMLKASPENTVGGVFVRSSVDDALVHVTAAYYDDGYINVKVGPVAVNTPSPDKIEVSIPIDEGDQFRLGKLSVKGSLVGPERAYIAQLKLRSGKVFSRTEIGAAINRLAEFHKSKTKGTTTPNVTPLTQIDTKKRRIDIAFDIE